MRRIIRKLGGPFVNEAAKSWENRQASMQRTAPNLKATLRALFLQYDHYRRSGHPVLSSKDVGCRVFSQFDEDGIVLWLLATIGVGPRRFVDIGAGDGLTSRNCANLALNLGFYGLFIEANQQLVDKGSAFYRTHPDTSFYPPKFRQAYVTRENVNQLIEDDGFKGEVDLLSIDIDGNDYWIWEILSCISPRIVIVEGHPELGTGNVVVPYSQEFKWAAGSYGGASLLALTILGRRLGYRLVGANQFGFNLFFVRDDLAGDLVPEINVSDLFQHPRNQARSAIFETIKHLEYDQAQ